MQPLKAVHLRVINLPFYFSRSASALFCKVSLPQHDNFFCKKARDAALTHQRFIYKLKHDENLHGFALLDMGPVQLNAVALSDPFMSDYTIQYLAMVAGNQVTLGTYNFAHLGKEINDISEYLSLSEFFQSIAKGVNTNFLCLICNRVCLRETSEFRNKDGDVTLPR